MRTIHYLTFNMRKKFFAPCHLIFIFLMSAASGQSIADSFDAFGDHEKLRDNLVIAVGEIAEFSQPQRYPNDSLQSRTTTIYQIGLSCFHIDENVSRNAGMLVADRFNNLTLAVFERSVTNIKIKTRPAVLLDCVQVLRRQAEGFSRDGDMAKQQAEMRMQQVRKMLETAKQQDRQLKISQELLEIEKARVRSGK